MANFRKKPHEVYLCGCNGSITRVVTQTDESLQEHKVTVSDEPRFFKVDKPSPEVFSLKSKIDSGVTLKEEDSIVFKSDMLTAKEISKINEVINSDVNSEVENENVES